MGRIQLDELTSNNLGVIEKINDVCLPIKFKHQWYASALEQNQGNMIKYAYYNELPVGAIKARIVTEKGHSSPSFVYIDTIAVLEPYRGLGIGAKLLEWLIEECKSKYVHKIQCHGWEESIGWYISKGFTSNGKVKDYYKPYGFTGEKADATALSLEF